MGQQIIKQPNGLYCLFSSVIDNIIYYNMSEEEIVEVWTEEAKKEFEQKVEAIIEKLEKGENPYYQFTLSFDECINIIKGVHGKVVAKNVRITLEKG